MGLAVDRPYCAPRLVAKLPIAENFKTKNEKPSTSGQNTAVAKDLAAEISSPRITDDLCDTNFSLSSPFMAGLLDSNCDDSTFMSTLGTLELNEDKDNLFGAPNEDYALSDLLLVNPPSLQVKETHRPDPFLTTYRWMAQKSTHWQLWSNTTMIMTRSQKWILTLTLCPCHRTPRIL